ncbi:MAG: hypothetical protein K8R59_08585, partial [Thermoanaerobaculales bacterium]|nr:hypothetical protein [Thermoanaerobaculales bacterium]
MMRIRTVMNFLSLVFAVVVSALVITIPAGAAYVDLRLPSESTGGGTLAVRVTYPASPEEFRYGDSGGAPVVVVSPGGFSEGGLDLMSASAYTVEGLIVITFLYPGGGPPGIGSDGVYDERGDTSQRALRDVLLFAGGELRDSFDRSLSEIVGGNAREDLAGILALSNGGSIAITTLARYGDEIRPLAFLVSWESPTSDQILGVELGAHDLDPDPEVDFNGDGVLDNDVINGAYIGYDFPQLDIDYDRMKYAPDATLFVRGRPRGTGLFFFDNDGDGVLTLSDPATGETDTNSNGALDPEEDFPLAGVNHTPVPGGDSYQMLSRAATAYAHAAGLSDPWPSHYATEAQTAAYWSIRDAAELFPTAMASQPNIAGMSLFGIRDHVQSTTDHAHIHHYVDGFLGSGHWHRLNPDRVYIEAVAHGVFPTARDNDAELSPLPEEFQGLAEPDDLISRTVLVVAGLSEMADRVNSSVWDHNLDTVIDGPPQPEQKAHWVTFAVNCHDWVNPIESADTIEFVLDTLEEFGARGDFYVTASVVAAWEAEAPELIERLRDSEHTISYHARPPHPVAFSPTRDQLDTVALADFETYRQNLSTGELDLSRPGGYTYVSQVFGRGPHGTGLAYDNIDLSRRFARITAAHGARVAVFSHGPASHLTGYDNLAIPEQGMYPRPNDFFVARVDQDGYPGDGDFWWNRIAQEQLTVVDLTTAFRNGYLNGDPSAPNEPDFAVVVIHENNFYMTGAPWKPVYYEDPDATIPKPAPWDLNATASWVTARSADEIQRIRTAFRALVETAALSDNAAIVTSEEISVLADSFFTPASEPQQDLQWLQAGGFEEQPPEGYDWAESQPVDSNWGGSFSLTQDAADTDDL